MVSTLTSGAKGPGSVRYLKAPSYSIRVNGRDGLNTVHCLSGRNITWRQVKDPIAKIILLPSGPSCKIDPLRVMVEYDRLDPMQSTVDSRYHELAYLE